MKATARQQMPANPSSPEITVLAVTAHRPSAPAAIGSAKPTARAPSSSVMPMIARARALLRPATISQISSPSSINRLRMAISELASAIMEVVTVSSVENDHGFVHQPSS